MLGRFFLFGLIIFKKLKKIVNLVYPQFKYHEKINTGINSVFF